VSEPRFAVQLETGNSSNVQIKTEKISELTVNRLSIYLRCLVALANEGIQTISSQTLAERFSLNSAQIRKDLAYFGEFGVRGVGYYVDDLRRHITAILGLDTQHRLAVVGAGNLGLALANYDGFSGANFRMVAMFDNDPAKVGTTSGRGVPVYPVDRLAEIVASESIDIAAIAVPAHSAQAALDVVVGAGIRAVLNFAPARISGPSWVKIRTVDLTISLEGLSYALARPHGAAAPVSSEESEIEIAEEHETV
jgi:redox-sensing transcriptional repressor